MRQLYDHRRHPAASNRCSAGQRLELPSLFCGVSQRKARGVTSDFHPLSRTVQHVRGDTNVSVSECRDDRGRGARDIGRKQKSNAPVRGSGPVRSLWCRLLASQREWLSQQWCAANIGDPPGCLWWIRLRVKKRGRSRLQSINDRPHETARTGSVLRRTILRSRIVFPCTNDVVLPYRWPVVNRRFASFRVVEPPTIAADTGSHALLPQTPNQPELGCVTREFGSVF